MGFAELRQLADDAAAPVHDGAEDVERQCPRPVRLDGSSRKRSSRLQHDLPVNPAVGQSSAAPPAPPTADTAPAAVASGPRRPAPPSPAPITACDAGMRLMNSPRPTPTHADVAQQQPVDLDRRDTAARCEARAPAAAPRSPAPGSRRRTPPRRPGRRRRRRRGRRCASRTACAHPSVSGSTTSAPSDSTKSVAPRTVHHRDHLGAHRLCDLDGRRADAARRAEHQHGLARPQRGAARQCEVHRVVVAQQRTPPRRRRGRPGVGTTLAGGTATRSAQPPSMRQRRNPLPDSETRAARRGAHDTGDLRARDERRRRA